MMKREMYFFIGLGLLIILGLIFVATNFFSEKVDERSFDELSASEQRAIVDESLSKSSDSHYFSTAKLRDNNYFCQFIVDDDLQEECFNLIVNHYEP